MDSKSTKNISSQEDFPCRQLAEDIEEKEMFDLIENRSCIPDISNSKLFMESPTVDELKLNIRRNLELRKIQNSKRKEILFKNIDFLKRKSRDLLSYVANGEEVIPAQIEPELVLVKSNTTQSDIFRFLTLYWSVPVSQGYGRRMRFLVKDKQNNKIIGLFALADPVFNLRVRDTWIGWNVEQRRNKLRSVMDAFVLGAVPPYSMLLGGKLVCVLTTSKEVREAYRKKYQDTISVISKRRHNNELLLLTTTSALGKSSLYDRVKLGNRLFFIPVGNTRGYGHFHIPQEIFHDMRLLLERISHPYAKGNRFGQGPNWRMRVIRKALQECNLSSQMLQHSIERTSYLIPLAENSKEILRGIESKPRFYEENVYSLSEAALNRWIIPRSMRRPQFKDFKRLELMKSIIHATGRFDDT